MENTIKILQVERKGKMLDTLENFYIYNVIKQGLQIDKNSTSNPIYEFLTKTKKNIQTQANPTQNLPTHRHYPSPAIPYLYPSSHITSEKTNHTTM
jgi:hypothetical protein